MFVNRVEKVSSKVERHGVRLSAAFLVRGPCHQTAPTHFGLPRELKPHPTVLLVGSGEFRPPPTRVAVIAPMNRTDWTVGGVSVPVQLSFSR